MSRPRPRPRRAGPPRLVAFNKPMNVLSQFTGDGHWPGLAAHLDLPGLYPAGRLDRDSEGLLLLTNDGRLQSRLTHPRHKLAKTYLVLVEGAPRDDDLQPLRDGLVLNDGPTLPAEIRPIAPPDLWPRDPPVRARKTVPDQWLEITIREGRNRQIRRMTAAIGLPTLRLVRRRIGPVELGDLLPGQCREVDIAALGL